MAASEPTTLLARSPTTLLYTAAQVRELDRQAIEELHVDGYALMEQAGEAAFAALLVEWTQVRHVVVICGAGNNGGDGYVIARLAQEHGFDVQLWAATPVDKLSGSAKLAADAAIESGVSVQPLRPGDLVTWPSTGVVVDALLGTGLQGNVRAEQAAIIEQMNLSGLPVLAVDVPSGLCSDTGNVLGCAVKADLTITMIAHKRGLFTAQGPVYAGDVRLAKLGVPQAVLDTQIPSGQLMSWHQIQRLNPLVGRRVLDAHKGHFGHVVICGGDSGFGGAVIMAAGAALRAGAGLVSVATHGAHIAPLLARYPEVMAHAVAGGQDAQGLLAKADVIVIGPGLGQGHWGQQLLQQVMLLDTPVVLDADALNLLAQGRIQHNLGARDSVMTPHPGEAARLLDVATDQIQRDRFYAANQLSERYHSHVVLKGLGTLVTDGQHMRVCTDGNPGMASGGMGDVLCGILGAMLAIQQNPATHTKCSLKLAVETAVCLHSAAADMASAEGENGMVATDLLPSVRRLLA